jgi:hypothetical protein
MKILNKGVPTFFCITLISASLFGQTNETSLTEEKVKYQYDNDKPEEHYTPQINIGE